MHFSKIWDFLRASTTTKHKSRRGTRLVVEVLEDRSVPSATASGVVSGTTFYDAANNGTYDAATDALLPGVQVTLSGTTTQLAPVNATATTDANGAFTFLNVLPGAYHLQSGPSTGLIGGTTSVGVVTAPTGVTITAPPAAGSGNVGRHDVLDLAHVGMGLFMTDTTLADFPSGDPGSGQALANIRPNSAPTTVAAAQTTFNLPQGTPSTQLDLASYFTDPDITNSQVTFHITNGGTPETLTVNLFDTTAPQTVANFLDYVNAGDYNNSIFSRLVSGFVLQGGGAALTSGGNGLTAVAVNPAVPNEFAAPNTADTLTMAQSPNDINSATNQFFFNTVDNSAANATNNLDAKKFTVFGNITDVASQATLTTLAGTATQNETAAASVPNVDLNNLPLSGYTPASPNAFPTDATGHFMVIKSVSIDRQDEFLSYKILSNSNPTLVTTPALNTTLPTEHLALNYTAGQTGTAAIVVQATDRFGATVNQTINVTIFPAPVITTATITADSPVTTLTANPVATPFTVGDTVTFTYQWLHNGVDIAGANAQSLNLTTTTGLTANDSITVQVTPTEGTAVGAVFTNGVTITGTSPITIV